MLPRLGPGFFQVDLLVSHIQVPAGHHRLLGGQGGELLPKGLIPGQAVIQPFQALLGVWGVAGDQVEVLVFQGDHPPLLVQLLYAQAVLDGQGRRFGKDGGARIALLLGGAPELGVAWGVQLNLPRLELGFLEAEEICVPAGGRYPGSLFARRPRRPFTFQEMKRKASPPFPTER